MPIDDVAFSEIYKNKNVAVQGIVADDPDIKNGVAKFTLKVSEVNGQQVKVGTIPKLLVKSENLALLYGDKIKINAVLERPEAIVNEDGRTFNYPAYLSKDNIFYIATSRSTTILSRNNGNPIVSSLYTFKRSFIEHINRILPSPHAFLASGLIISGKGSLDKKLQEDFQRVGLIHIVVLSGFNISIIGEALVRMFSFLPATLGAIFGGAGIILFSIMTGGGSTVVRSAIMSIIGLYARISGRINSAITSLMFAAVLMLMWNPRLALYDPSFQLSFAATLGLILYSEPIELLLTPLAKRLRFSHDLLALVSSTMATQIFTLPLIMRLSGVVSLVALPVNIVVLPFIPITMFFVFIAGAVSFISFSLAVLPAFVSYLLLAYELGVVQFSSALPFAAIKLPPVSDTATFISYIVLTYIGAVAYRKALRKNSKSKKPPLEAHAYLSNTPAPPPLQYEKTPP